MSCQPITGRSLSSNQSTPGMNKNQSQAERVRDEQRVGFKKNTLKIFEVCSLRIFSWTSKYSISIIFQLPCENYVSYFQFISDRRSFAPWFLAKEQIDNNQKKYFVFWLEISGDSPRWNIKIISPNISICCHIFYTWLFPQILSHSRFRTVFVCNCPEIYKYF